MLGKGFLPEFLKTGGPEDCKGILGVLIGDCTVSFEKIPEGFKYPGTRRIWVIKVVKTSSVCSG